MMTVAIISLLAFAACAVVVNLATSPTVSSVGMIVATAGALCFLISGLLWVLG